MRIKELDIVILKKDLPKYNLKRGQKAIVALIMNRKIEVILISREIRKLIPLPINVVEKR